MSKSPASTTRAPRQRIQARRSGVHGKGVFALVDLAEGETLIEYTGEIIDWEEALERHPHDPQDPNHTFYFHVDEGLDADATGLHTVADGVYASDLAVEAARRALEAAGRSASSSFR